MKSKENILSEIIDKKIWFKVDDQVYSYDLIDLLQSSFSKSKSKVKAPDQILATMPGKITKIFVKPQQDVRKGDALIVLEAMKMEYTLKSSIDSIVESVSVRINEQVSLGQLLVKLKVASE